MNPRTTTPHGSLLLLLLLAGLGCDARDAGETPEALSVERSGTPPEAEVETVSDPAHITTSPAEPPAAPRGKACPSTILPAMPAKDLCAAYVAKIGASDATCDRDHLGSTALVDSSDVSLDDSAQFPVIALAGDRRATVFGYDDGTADADRYQLAILSAERWTIWPFATMDHSGSRWTHDYIRLALRTESLGLGHREAVVVEWIVGYEIDNEYLDHHERGADHYVAALLPRGETADWLAVVPLPMDEFDPRARATVEWEAGPNQLEVRDAPTLDAVGPKGTFAYGEYPAACPGDEVGLESEPGPAGSSDPLPSTVVTFQSAWTPIAAEPPGARRVERLCRARTSLLEDADAIDKYAVPAGLEEDVWVRVVESLQCDFEELEEYCKDGDHDALEKHYVLEIIRDLDAVIELVEG